MKKRIIIGYIHCDNKNTIEERVFMHVLKENNCKPVMFNICKKISENDIEKKAKECDIVFNNSAEDFALEFVKTIENLGIKVIDSSKTYYDAEDKWIFYLKCKKHKIPVPETILLSENLNLAKKQLIENSKWPVVLKRVSGTMGEYVSLAKNTKEAETIIKKFWKKGSQRLPIIAQEFIESDCYRVTIVNGKIMQAALKKRRGWKATGVYSSQESIGRFEIDHKLRKICKKISKYFKIKVCGIDLLKKDNEWFVIEINSQPAFDFFSYEREKLIQEIVKFLIKEVKKIRLKKIFRFKN